jgi:hypothetical protein
MTRKQPTHAPRRSTPRPWVLPPARILRPEGYVRGDEILAEVPDPLGILLWLLHRDVELWAGTPPAVRADLFRIEDLGAWQPADLPNELREVTHALVGALAGVSSASNVTRIATACAEIADWSTARAPQTALLFAEAAARADPSSAEAARRVARYAVPCSLAGVESWLNRAVALARRSGDFTQYAHAVADMAELTAKGGDRDTAERDFTRARQMYRRYQLPRDVKARAEIGLLRIALDRGSPEEVEIQINRALGAFRYDDPRYTATRIEVARVLVERRSMAHALAILETTPRLATPAEQAQIAALTTAAESLSAAAGEREGAGQRCAS